MADMAQNTRDQQRVRRARRADPLPDSSGMPSDHVGVLLAGLVMMLIGWGGLYWLVTTQDVGLGPQIWGFFMLLHLAITGTVLPVVRFINVRFTRIDDDLPSGGVIVRESAWVGLFVVICAWLQILRALSAPVVLVILLVFIVLEAFIRSRESNDDEG